MVKGRIFSLYMYTFHIRLYSLNRSTTDVTSGAENDYRNIWVLLLFLSEVCVTQSLVFWVVFCLTFCFHFIVMLLSILLPSRLLIAPFGMFKHFFSPTFVNFSLWIYLNYTSNGSNIYLHLTWRAFQNTQTRAYPQGHFYSSLRQSGTTRPLCLSGSSTWIQSCIRFLLTQCTI